ncbi:lipase family protein [Aliikangiella sp. G2MR2-5]|uniref:lipase family protein n=1 Tax=Aliikangiella sp. G2MR2-5 TaxID=2788943 RepID=UPI0018AB2523|nr:lipase family protein [Aliikangiella sp. G2MR2-5]
MAELNPSIAASLASEIYDVQDNDAFQLFLARGIFSKKISHKSKLTATVGGRLINKAKDGFGLCAMGDGAKHKGDAFFIFRGTTMANNKADVISDARIGTQFSKTGTQVHIGFNEVFKSMLQEIRQFIKDNSGELKGMIHCVGHSLGGAVATLAADWLKSNTGRTVKLYTFGQPRTGLALFNWKLTSKLTAGNIHRVFHSTDPVPMVPIFPYLHSPTPGDGHYIHSENKIISGEAHKMAGYIKSVKNMSWTGLQRRAPVFNHEQAIVELLESKVGLNPENPKTWAWLDAALIFVIKKVVGNAISLIHSGIVGIHTLADRIAWILEKGIHLAESVSYYVKLFIKKIMQVLGMRPVEDSKKLTRSFLQGLLRMLIHRSHELAKKAFRNL